MLLYYLPKTATLQGFPVRRLLSLYSCRFLNPLNVTPVTPGEDIAGIHNFDIFVIQETAKTEGAVTTDYDKFIVQKINEMSVTFRPKSGAEDKVLQISLDSTQGIQHVMTKVVKDLPS